MKTCESFQDKLSAYIDGELTQQESQRVALHLRECERCRATHEDFARLRREVKQLDFPAPSDDEWRHCMAGLVKKTTLGVGGLLWIGGAVVLCGYGLYELLTDPSIDALQRVSVLAILLGVVLVFLTVLVGRVSGYKHDKYKDVNK